MIPSGMERQSSIGQSGGTFDQYQDFDTESFVGSEHSGGKGSTLGRRLSFGKNSNYSSVGTRGTLKSRMTAGPSNRFPTMPTAFPKAPTGTSFPMVPESTAVSNTSSASSETNLDQVYGELTNSNKEGEFGTEAKRQSSFDLPLPPPPPPESPPPDFPPYSPDFDTQTGLNSIQRQDTINMLPPPDFD